MKLTLLSKSARAIGSMAMLSMMIGITAAQAADCPNAAGKTRLNSAIAAKPTTPGTVVDIAAGNPNFSTLVAAVKAAGLAETLSSKGPFTVFAPTNEAFAALPKGTLETLLKPENRKLLQKVLTYHVVSGDLMAKDLRSGKVATVEGNPVAVQVSKNGVKVNDVNVIKADVDASNGVIHVIDKVLLPPGLAPIAANSPQQGTIVEIAVGNPSFSTLVKAVQAAGLAETLSSKGPFTLFAPTNEAFAALPKGTLETLLKPENRKLLQKVLTYHVVSGDLLAKDLRSGKVATVEGNSVAVQVDKHGVKVNSSNVIKADIDAKNGVIHVIDKVLLPPGLMPTTPVATQSVVEIAASNSAFSTLVTAVKAAGLAETLSGKGPFTVFAPTNDAFAALPKGTLEKLLKPENRDLLRKVLTYHVVSGDLMAKDLRSGKVATVEGNAVAVKVLGQKVSVNNANVIKADVDAKNGVVHAIDQVLLPPGL
jgi:transforming growth factor-beta-induced protein